MVTLTTGTEEKKKRGNNALISSPSHAVQSKNSGIETTAWQIGLCHSAGMEGNSIKIKKGTSSVFFYCFKFLECFFTLARDERTVWDELYLNLRQEERKGNIFPSLLMRHHMRVRPEAPRRRATILAGLEITRPGCLRPISWAPLASYLAILGHMCMAFKWSSTLREKLLTLVLYVGAH